MYIDTCMLVKLYFNEPESDAVQNAIKGHCLVASELALAEFASCVARKQREKAVSKRQAEEVMALFNSHIESGSLEIVKLNSSSLEAAAKLFTEVPLSTPLRTLDAIHLAVCKEQKLFPLLTNDKVMAAAAKHLKLPCASA